MAKHIVTDELWAVVEPLIPKYLPSPKGGRPPVADRAALTGILFVLKTGLPWEYLPVEMNCGCGMTCWRRLRNWQAAGIWDRLHVVLLERLEGAHQIDWSRASLDSASVPAPLGGESTGPNPTDRGKKGSKRHVIVDRQGVPLAVRHTAANVNEGQMLEALVDAIPPLHRPGPGRPRKRPKKLHADKAYDSRKNRQWLRRRGIKCRIARRGIEPKDRLGRHRWVVERTLSWFNRFRRLKVRYERRADIHQAFLTLAAAMITWNMIKDRY